MTTYCINPKSLGPASPLLFGKKKSLLPFQMKKA